MLRQTVREWVVAEVEPQAEAQDLAGALNLPLLRRAGELGLLGVTVPDPDGGAGMDATAAVIAHEEIARSDPGFGLAYLAHAILFAGLTRIAAFSAMASEIVRQVRAPARLLLPLLGLHVAATLVACILAGVLGTLVARKL